MKEVIPLDRLREVLDYNAETGLFYWKHATGRKNKIGYIAGHKSKRGYVIIGIDCSAIRAHRLAWYYYYGQFPRYSIDHINGIRHDNRICNLRDVDNTVNTENQKRATRQNKSSGTLGVSREKNHRRWRAVIETKGKQIHIGYYDTIEDAQTAYINKKRQLHAGCTL